MKKINKSNSESKKGYNKPKVKTIKLRHEAHLLAGSCASSAPTAPIWGGEGN